MTHVVDRRHRQISIGRRVRYILTAAEAVEINDWRLKPLPSLDRQGQVIRPPRQRFQKHVGTLAVEGDVVPLDVTRVVTAGQVNGKALLDGNDVLWVTGVYEGSEPGTWQWPPRKRE